MSIDMKKLFQVMLFIRCCLACNVNTDDSRSENCVKDQTCKIKCDFERCLPAQNVSWYKDNKTVTNGTDGLYQIEDQLSDVKLRSTLHFSSVRMEHEGYYTCKAKISHNSSYTSKVIEVSVECPPGYITAKPNNANAVKFSNTSIKCSVLSWQICWTGPVVLTWHFRNMTLQNNTKYTIRRRHPNNECPKKRLLQAEFILDIFNVTDEDDGIYFCQMSCDYGIKNAKDVIKLVSYYPEKETTTMTTTVRSSEIPILEDTTASGEQPSGPQGEWFVAVVVGVSAVLAILLVVVCALIKMKFAKYRGHKYNSEEGIANNKLFISYSSKDFAWVNENLISLIEKHSIPYSIHTRDFELGKPFVQNMADSVYGSRQVLIVLSDNYLASNFCLEELHMAVQRRVYTGDSSLIVVLINKLKKKRLPFSLRNKNLLVFDERVKTEDWEKTIMGKIIDEKTVSA